MTHHETLLGLVLWALVFYPVWSPRCRRIRKRIREEERSRARPSTPRPVPRTVDKSGPKWEQDEPYPECFETDEGDDLDG